MAAEDADLEPRSYQRELMEIAVKRNTIIFLPTGSGKTFIAVMVLKHLSAPLARPYCDDGQISIVLVNAVPLVEQHANVLKTRTHFEVGAYSGDMNVDNWAKEQWIAEFNKHQVLVMTVQILVNICNWGFLDLNRVNLLVFDECHHGVKDQPMRQVMRGFQTLSRPPRVLGLTATLLNANCKPDSVMSEVANLEVTYQGKVATVEELQDVVGFATNPQESLKVFKKPKLGDVEQTALEYLSQLLFILEGVIMDTKTYTLQKSNLKPLDPADGLCELRCMVKDFIFHLDMFGVLGIYTAAICYNVQLERLTMHCEEIKLFHLFNCVKTTVSHIKHMCQEHMGECTVEEKLERHTSDQVKVLIEVLREFRARSNQELCSIVFVDRRFTAKILFHILKMVSETPEFSYIKPDFMVGYSNSPYNTTREGLYVAKQNKKVVQGFCNKETNLVVASNVLEEGVDIPNCSLVVKFNKPLTYRSYVQSKGRARHKESFYYILVQDGELMKFCQSYNTFRSVEQILNRFLVGQNTTRQEPTQKDIDDMYNELEFRPYIVNSARVDLLSAIALLSQYCQSFSCDKYTVYNPEWYIEKNTLNEQRVVILMPLPCPIKEPIVGPFVSSTKLAKRAAALSACIHLHKIGELDDHLKPKKLSIEQDTKFLFPHWPEENEKNVGFSKTKRMHKKEIPDFCRKPILSLQKVYIHVIHLTPLFAVNSSDINLGALFDTFNSNLSYGLITANPLPEICSFPIYVSAGQIQVDFKVNQTTIELTEEQIRLIRRFHVFVFADVIRILQSFLMMDNGCDTAMMLLVPILRDSVEIDFDVVEKYEKMEPVEEPSRNVKAGLVVTADNYLGKIITPWYRPQETHYLVSKICENQNATSPFPSEEFETFVDYYYDKYKAVIVQPTAPLLFVKGLSKRMNCIKPRGIGGKRRKDLTYEEMNEHLIAEMCVKHEYPAPLFIQAHLIPTVMYHVMQLLLVENLRRKIARETGMGKVEGVKWEALQLDEHLLNYEFRKPIDPVAEYRMPQDSNVPALLSTPFDEISTLNHDVTVKMLEAEFPWKDIEEPKDINRDINVTVMDVIMYENFVCVNVNNSERTTRYKPVNTKQQAITYVKEFEEKHIELLLRKNNPIGPQLSQVYTSMCTAKSNGLVNLERLETLGDSFLKLVSSLYILMRFPNFDEGKSTTLKGKLISNKNLFYLGRIKHFGGYILDSDLFPESQWLPPAFTVPQMIQEKIVDREISIKNLFNVFIPLDEQISGDLGEGTKEDLEGIDDPVEEDEQNQLSSLSGYLRHQYIGDKTVADSVEALLGCYFHSNGFEGGVTLIEWLKIIPKSEKLLAFLTKPPPNPIIPPGLSVREVETKVDFHIPHWRVIEQKLGYHFQNRGFLLQALTHPSYSCNRITHCYERLEFLGDAVLDFLITCFIYEQCGHLNPGEITDLRSALVNNNTFASYTVRCGFHKFFLNLNPRLTSYVDKFAEFQESRGHVIDDTVLILLQENDFNLAEHIDVPKALGDLFEALAGAVYLDSGKDLNVVWRVFYKIMWKEIDLFSHNVPKNVVRLLHEKGVHAKFFNPVEIGSGVTMIRLEFILDGAKKHVHGFGDNKTLAKRAAAKIALRLLDKKIM